MKRLPPAPALFPTPAARRWFWLLRFNAVSVPILVVLSLMTWVWVSLAALSTGSLPSSTTLLSATLGVLLAGLWAFAGIRLSLRALDRIASAHKGLPNLPSI